MINPMILVCPLDLVHYISTAQVMDMIWTVINSDPKPADPDPLQKLSYWIAFFARGYYIRKKTGHLQKLQTVAQGLPIFSCPGQLNR